MRPTSTPRLAHRRFAATSSPICGRDDWVVFELAPRVVDAAAPAAGDALLKLQNRGVVLVLSKRRLTHEDVAKLRIRAEQLAARDRRAGDAEALPRRQSEERIRNLRVEPGA